MTATKAPGDGTGRPFPDLVVAEYTSLRAEILKLIELQGQLLALTVVAFGTIVSVGFQVDNASVVLLHPILALILGVSWMNHAHSVCRCAAYIRAAEKQFDNLRQAGQELFSWEGFVMRNPTPRQWIGFWGVRAIFAISALIAVVVSLALERPQGMGILIFSLSSAITAVLFWLSITWQERPDPSSRPIPERTRASAVPPHPRRTETSLPTSSAAGDPSADPTDRETTR